LFFFVPTTLIEEPTQTTYIAAMTSQHISPPLLSPSDAGPPTPPSKEWVLAEEIKNYFWPADVPDTTHPVPFGHCRTLNDSAETPGKLAYVLLYDGETRK